MALSGTLKDFALPDIFQLIGMQRKTGLLTLENERETVSVVFEQGMVVHADSTVRRLDDLLGNVLVRHGKLRKETLEEALQKQKVSMQRLGFILTHNGYISREDLKGALSEQVQQIVFRVFRWKSGRYHFDPSAGADYDRENVDPVSTDHILMEGIRRVDEWPIIEKRIPSLDFVFRPLVPFKQIRVEENADEGGGLGAAFDNLEGGGGSNASPSSDVVMNPQEAAIYKHVDGHRSVSAIMELTGLSDFDACRTLFDFIDRNLVAAAGQGQARTSTAGRAPTVSVAPSSAVGTVALVVVLALSGIGLAVALWTPFRIPTLPSFMRQEAPVIERSRDVARLERLGAALRTYYLTFGSYPVRLDDLVNASPPLLEAGDLVDATGDLFLYRVTPERVIVEAVDASGTPYLSLVREILPDDVTLGTRAPVGSSNP